MTTTTVIGLIVMVLVISGLGVTVISKGNSIGYKIQIFIQSTALILTVYELILKINTGETVFATIFLLIVILINLIQNIVYLAREN